MDGVKTITALRVGGANSQGLLSLGDKIYQKVE